MTVAELIAELQKYAPDTNVVICNSSYYGTQEIEYVDSYIDYYQDNEVRIHCE